MIGRTLGHYRIVERLGAGGMGEVYRARDEKLGREVAVKVLPSGALADEDARRRFRKEAAVLSRLTHPHIASLLDADSADGTDFLVMELVPGATLELKLHRGPLAEKEAVRLGAQLARGLMAAHEQGVVHRDLKPSNLALTSDGLLKVLDFGVAHLEPDARAEPGESATTATTHSGRGVVVGSPPYMSPEQLLGQEVDARTDLYSAGAVLYELVTGKRPFGAKTGVELHDAVLHEAPPPPRELNGQVTPGLEAVILKALDKDKALRYQSARELLVDLERLQAGASGTASSSSAQTARSRSRSRRRRWAWAALVVAIVAGAVTSALWPPPALRIVGIRPVTRGLAGITNGWTSDGARLYYSVFDRGRTSYYQVQADGGEPTEIPTPFRYGGILAYLRRQGSLLVTGWDTQAPEGSRGVPLWVASVPGGGVQRLGTLTAWFAAPSPDEERLALVYGSGEDWHIGIASIDGSGLRELTKATRRIRFVCWAPDGRRLRFVSAGPPGHEAELWQWETSLGGESPRPLFPGRHGQWTPDGRHFVFFSRPSLAAWTRGDLWSVREGGWVTRAFHPSRLSLGPVSLTMPGFGPDGRLFASGDLPGGELLRYNASAHRFDPFLGGISAHYVDVSPDGQSAVYVTHPEGELWTSRTDGSGKRQLSPKGVYCRMAHWSPDGRSIAYVASGSGEYHLRRVLADGSADEVLVRPEPEHSAWDVCWLPGGEELVFSHLASNHPGVFKVDLRTRQVSALPGADKLSYPKCSRRGDILATVPGSVDRYWIRWHGRTDWEPVTVPQTYCNWTRDGEAIIGLNLAAHRAERFSLTTRTSTVIADLSGMPLVVGTGVPWMGLDASDAPLVLRDRGVKDLYAIHLSTDAR